MHLSELVNNLERDFFSGLDSQPDRPDGALSDDQRLIKYLQDQIAELIVERDEYQDRVHDCVLKLKALKSKLERLAA